MARALDLFRSLVDVDLLKGDTLATDVEDSHLFTKY
jgi:hypothetical protein